MRRFAIHLLAASVGALCATQAWAEDAKAPVAAATAATPPAAAPAPAAEPKAGPSSMDVERLAHYQELRSRAKEMGVDMPETPAWANRPSRPAPPKMMSDEERKAHYEAMRNMSMEERMAARDKWYDAMRERAKERGIDLPTPPWKEDGRREQMRKTMDAMTPEQRAACMSMHRHHMPPMSQMPPMPLIPQMPENMSGDDDDDWAPGMGPDRGGYGPGPGRGTPPWGYGPHGYGN
ncbi:MAG: hypothetical protein WCP34_07305 [Pseudomonadota bacterium]